MRRVNDQARAKKFDKNAQQGKPGISSGASQANAHKSGYEFETWGEPAGTQAGGGSDPQDVNSTTIRQGKGPEGQRALTIRQRTKAREEGIHEVEREEVKPRMGGRFICGGKHRASECPQSAVKMEDAHPRRENGVVTSRRR